MLPVKAAAEGAATPRKTPMIPLRRSSCQKLVVNPLARPTTDVPTVEIKAMGRRPYLSPIFEENKEDIIIPTIATL